jgi:hypothetical protein
MKRILGTLTLGRTIQSPVNREESVSEKSGRKGDR